MRKRNKKGVFPWYQHNTQTNRQKIKHNKNKTKGTNNNTSRKTTETLLNTIQITTSQKVGDLFMSPPENLLDKLSTSTDLSGSDMKRSVTFGHSLHTSQHHTTIFT